MALAGPFAGYAQGGEAEVVVPRDGTPVLQLAAAIGIVKPVPEPEPVPVQVPEPAPPVVVTPPVAEQPVVAEAPEEKSDEDTDKSGGVTRNQILVGVGVAALIGVLAGGGGGGSSSTPSHD